MKKVCNVVKKILKTVGNSIKKLFYNVLLFLVKYWTLIVFTLLTILFVAILVVLICYDRMGEVDTAIKYLLVPIYIFSAVFSGRIATQKARRIILRIKKREPESRWATKYEIKSDKYNIKEIDINKPSYNYAGLPFVVEKSTVYVDNSEAHSLIIGSTGSGKTRRLVLPLINILARKGESIVATDPKGELYQKTKKVLTENDYKIIQINLREPSKGNAWNPLSIPYRYFKTGNKDKAMELIYDLAYNIFYDKSNSNKDPFWEHSASSYFAGLALSLFEIATEEEINLNSIINMNNHGQEKIKSSTYIKEFFDLRDKTSIAYTSAAGTVNAPNDTKGGILSVFNQKLSIYSSQVELSKMLAYSDFDMSDIGKKKTAVFIIMQDEKSTYHPLVSAFIKQCYEVLIGVAQSNNGKLKIRTNFVLDEFANLPAITDMSNMITAARSRNIRLNLIIQGFGQLAAQYGKETAEVIKGNCSNWFFLVSKELNLLKEISELCGNTEEQIGINQFKEHPLVSVAQLQRFQVGEILIRRDREHPYKAYLPDISEYSPWNNTGDFVDDTQERGKVRSFDIKNYVNDKKKERIIDNPSFPQNNSFTFNDPDVDVDEILKKIDAKITELEEEEKKEDNVKEKSDDNNKKKE